MPGGSAGLRVGDTGAVFYQLTVREQARRVEVGAAEVTGVEDLTATLRMASGEQVREGYRVEFSVPVGRLDRRETIQRTSAEVVELRERLEAAGRRIEELERDLESSLAVRSDLERSLEVARAGQAAPGELTAEQARRLREAETGRAEAEARARELEERLVASQMHAGEAVAELRSELDTERGKTALLQAEVAAFQAAAAPIADGSEDLEEEPRTEVELAETPPSTDPTETDPIETDATATDPTDGMIRLDSGRYAIGLPVSEASFYNQTPRFSRQIEALWVDSYPVTAQDFAKVAAAESPAQTAELRTGVTYAEAAAYCRSVGKRLPTEVEWEAAFTTAGLEQQPSILEWTSSWYQAYPGNDRAEVDYGQKFRVIRASSGSRRDRRYMAPNDRDGSVGFRCVRPEASD